MTFDKNLRELLHDKAAEAGPPSPAPGSLIRRGRRRQVRTVVLSAMVASAVVVGSLVGLSSLRGSHKKVPLGGHSDRTVTIQNVTLTSPADWTLLDLQANVQSSSPASQGAPNLRRATVVMHPLLELANFDPLGQPDGALPTSAFCPSSPPVEGGLLYMTFDVAGLGQPGVYYSEQMGQLHLDGSPTDGVCGIGYYARVLSGGEPYFAFAAFGDMASVETRQAIAAAWDSHAISGAHNYRASADQAGYVLANGAVDGRPWNLESAVDADGRISVWFISDVGPNERLAGPSTFSMQGGPLAPDGTIVGTTRVFWGAVALTISRVVYRPSDGAGETQGLIVPIAGIHSAPYNAFVLLTDADTPGQIVALDGDGTETAIAASARSDADMKNAESILRNALVAAFTYRHADGFTGFTPDEALGISPSLTYNTSPIAIPGEVSIRDVRKDSIVLVTATPNGLPLCIAANESKHRITSYGTTDAATATECSDPAWP